MAKDTDQDFSIDVGMSPETINRITDLGRRFEGWKARNVESHTGPPPPSPRSPITRNPSLDEEVGLDRPIREIGRTPRDLADTRGGLANVKEMGRRRRSLAGRRS